MNTVEELVSCQVSNLPVSRRLGLVDGGLIPVCQIQHISDQQENITSHNVLHCDFSSAMA